MAAKYRYFWHQFYLCRSGYAEWISFNPGIIRGFDYYDGMVFEVFDNHPDNNRSLFGGGRYNGLASLFGKEDIPAVGFSPGDETMKLFLDSWGLFPQNLCDTKRVYFPYLSANYIHHINQASRKLRQAGLEVEQGVDVQTMRQALGYASKKGMPVVLIFDEREAAQEVITIKNMKSGEQFNVSVNEDPLKIISVIETSNEFDV